MASDTLAWSATWRVDRYRIADLMSEEEERRFLTIPRLDPSALGIEAYDTLEQAGNLLMYGGASALWQRLIGTGVTAFDASNAYLGVGDSSTAEAATQTDLQAATNKSRKAMQATFPSHTDGTSSSTNATISFKSSWDTASGNYAWAEFGLFNASSSGRMLNRKVQSLGTKTASDTWTLTLSLTLA